MAQGHFLNPRIDNSHDGEVKRYRVPNALYYVAPGWTATDGGSLELWDGAAKERIEVPAFFNRLVMMGISPAGREYRHVTSFRGRPGQGSRTLVLRLDTMARNVFGRFLSNRALEAIRKVAYRRRG